MTKIFRGWGDNIGCYNCSELFGNGTITCDEKGATNCQPKYYITHNVVNDNLTNKHCKACSESIENCSRCQNETKCDICESGFMVD